MIRERKEQYKDHHKPCKLGLSLLKRGLEGADKGVLIEHLCPYGNKNVKTTHDVGKVSMDCVITVDDALLANMRF